MKLTTALRYTHGQAGHQHTKCTGVHIGDPHNLLDLCVCIHILRPQVLSQGPGGDAVGPRVPQQARTGPPRGGRGGASRLQPVRAPFQPV